MMTARMGMSPWVIIHSPSQPAWTSATSAGGKSLLCSVTDAQSRNGNVTISLAVKVPVVISQVYGGGGNAAQLIKNDFIELYNRTANPVDLTGWSVQYASAAGTSWQMTTLSGSIAAGKILPGAGSRRDGRNVQSAHAGCNRHNRHERHRRESGPGQQSTALTGACPPAPTSAISSAMAAPTALKPPPRLS